MSFKLKPTQELKPEKTLVSFRVDVELYERFVVECERADISVSEGMRQLMEQLCKPRK